MAPTLHTSALTVLTVLTALSAARPAAADTAIVLDKCTALDRVALHAAIQRELAASQVRPDVTLVIACPDAVTATITVEPAMGLSRTLDLGEVPSDLRVKLLAIAAVELVVVADPSKVPGPASERAGDAPRLPPPAVEPKPPAVAVTTKPSDDIDTISEEELPRRLAPAHVAIAPHLGVRFFSGQGKPLPHLAVDVELDRIAFGLTGTRGTAVEDPLGTLTPYLVTAAASFRLLCWGEVQLACLRVRVEAGVAGVSSKAFSPMVRATDARAFYGQAGVGLDIEHSFGVIGVVAAAEAAWAEGLVATAQDRQAVALDGFAITTVLGVRWRP